MVDRTYIPWRFRAIIPRMPGGSVFNQIRPHGGGSYAVAVKNKLNLHVILNGAQLRYESRRLKKEILRCAQNDK